jgi:hypothetical protein
MVSAPDQHSYITLLFITTFTIIPVGRDIARVMLATTTLKSLIVIIVILTVLFWDRFQLYFDVLGDAWGYSSIALYFCVAHLADLGPLC